MRFGRAVVALGVAAVACTGDREVLARRPNVLLVVLDDLSYRIGLYGYDVRTPQLERLARRGRRFDRAYCQYPLCSPSRTSFLTGWRPERTRVWGNLGSPRAHLAGVTPLQEHFRANGYFTARLGKIYHSRFESEFLWDLAEGPPPDSGEEETEGLPLWHASDRSDDQEPDGILARRTAALIESKKDRPFFVAVGFDKPHSPWVAPAPYFAAYPTEKVRLPPEGPPVPEMTRRIRGGATLPVRPGERQQAVAAYSACVSFVDAQVGVLLDALDRGHLWERTVVVVVGDNGLHLGQHGIWGKTTLYEDSARVPLVVAAPGLARPGSPTTELAELVDLYPTLVELGGLPRIDGLDGVSLVPLLRDPDHRIKAGAFTAKKTGATRKGELARSLRTERYRFTSWPDGSRELYDHDVDPDELRNLAGEPGQAAVVQSLQRTLDEGPTPRAPPSR